MPRILVVDDEPLNREAMARLGESMGFEVETAGNGLEALEVLNKRKPDVVLLDLSMPELDGFGVLERLRDRPIEPRPAVIIVTAQADVHGRLRGTELGAIDFVEKPFRLADLQRRVQRALSIVEMERRLKEAERALRALRSTDETTGVGSFGQLYTILDAEFRCAEIAERALSCVLVVDEAYGKVLQTAGRAAGEDRLQKLAHLIETTRRETDYVFRVDAAEFVILCPTTREADAKQVVGRVLEVLNKAGILGADDLAVAVATYPHPEITQASYLYRAANTALAQARSRLQDRIVYFERF
jgi:two-component system, cell cycle response regulator